MNLGAPTPGNREAFPLLNMAGNVWEWTEDWYSAKTYEEQNRTNPQGPSKGTEKVQRGGGWTDVDIRKLRSAGRAKLPAHLKLFDVGFRCVRDL